MDHRRDIKMRTRLLVTLFALFAACSAAAAETGKSAYDFAFTSIEGQPLPLAQFQGKVVLVVNTASRCGFTPQYSDLQSVWTRYRQRGLVVLGVPSNDFGSQELVMKMINVLSVRLSRAS